MKQMLYLMAARSITFECEWARIYRRLLSRMTTYDERTKDYRGKKKVLGRIAGQMASMIYALLKTDQETLSQVPLGKDMVFSCRPLKPQCSTFLTLVSSPSCDIPLPQVGSQNWWRVWPLPNAKTLVGLTENTRFESTITRSSSS